MATLKELKDRGDVPPMPLKLDTKQKESLADDGTIFAVTGVQHNPKGENGPYWTISADIDGAVVAFDLQGHPSRDPQMAALTALSMDGPIEGCVLRELSERMGNKFLVIDSAD